jgi:hypothetical protein
MVARVNSASFQHPLKAPAVLKLKLITESH